MSLINRMLRDLSSRQPASGNVMDGIQLPGAAPAPRGGMLGKLAALVVLVAGFTAVLWFVFGPKPVKIPQPRQPPPGAVVAEAPPQPEPAPIQAGAPAGEPAQLQMDTQLSGSARPPLGQSASAVPAPVADADAAPAQPPKPAAKKSRPRVATAEAPAKTPSPKKAADAHAQARRAMDRGDLQTAEAALLEALALDPQLHAAREDLGNLRVRQGRFDEAEADARAGLALDPSRVGYRRLLARVELSRGRPAAAVAVLEPDPPALERDLEYHALLASAYQRVNRHEDAGRSYAALARAEPYQAAWWAGYGLSRDALGDGPGALAAYARARQLGNLDPRVLEHINQRTLALQAAG